MEVATCGWHDVSRGRMPASDLPTTRAHTRCNSQGPLGKPEVDDESKVVPVKQRQKRAYKDPSRWRCPHPDCNRSFAVLWRLKVHYRAPVDARGSGVERGHGTELSHCPKCGTEFQEGRHHVNCSAGRTAGPPNPKRIRKRSAESSGSEGTATPPVVAKRPHPPQPEINAAFAQFLQSLAPPPPPTLEQQLLTTLLAASTVPTMPVDAAQALVSLKNEDQEAVLLAQLRSLLAAGGVADL